MATQKELDDWFAWRDQQRRRPRVMTLGEYTAWSRGGDYISSSSSANAFPGGLTIDFGTPAIIGKFGDE